MRKRYIIINLIGSINFLLVLYMFVMPRFVYMAITILSLLSLVITFIVTLILGLKRWRKSSPFWMGPSLMCLAFVIILFLAPPLGRFIADWQFKRHLNEYTAVVENIRRGLISNASQLSTGLHMIEVANRPNSIKSIWAARCPDGTMVVIFLKDSDVPLLHEGYAFKDYEEGNECVTESMRIERKLPYIRPVMGNWYHFSDQPGL